MSLKDIFSELYNQYYIRKSSEFELVKATSIKNDLIEIPIQFLYKKYQILDSIWEVNCDFEDENYFFEVDNMLQNQISLLFEKRVSEDAIIIINKHFDEIVNRKKSDDFKEIKDVINYFQLTSGICFVTHFNITGEFIYCYDIFMRSVFDKSYQNGETYDMNNIKIFNLLQSKNKYISNSLSVIEQWFSQLYYYSKSFSGLNEWCEYFFERLYNYYLNQNTQLKSYQIYTLSNLLDWCIVNENLNRYEAIKIIIQREYDNINSIIDNNNEIKYILGLQLILFKNYNNDNKLKLFNELLKNNLFNPLHKMQAAIALCYDSERLILNFNLVKNSIKEFNNSINDIDSDTISNTYQRSKLFKILYNFILTAIE
jgi:hypothetical protein